jgi:hypothetical protein
VVVLVDCIECGESVEKDQATPIGKPNGPDGDTEWLCNVCVAKRDQDQAPEQEDDSPDAPDLNPEEEGMDPSDPEIEATMLQPDDGGYSMSFGRAERAFERDRDRQQGC